LGLSITFVHDIVREPIPGTKVLLAKGWLLLALSLLAVLASMLTSQFALRRAIDQVDRDVAYEETLGGWYSRATLWLNVFAGLSFLIGLGFLAYFTIVNMEG